MDRYQRYIYVTEEAINTAGMNNSETAKFHYFNPNGKYEAWKQACERIGDLVDRGVVKSGWIFAYGSMNDYCAEELRQLAMKRRVNSIKLRVSLKMLQEQIDKMNAKADEAEKENA